MVSWGDKCANMLKATYIMNLWNRGLSKLADAVAGERT